MLAALPPIAGSTPITRPMKVTRAGGRAREHFADDFQLVHRKVDGPVHRRLGFFENADFA
jgi:hypothetical protein